MVQRSAAISNQTQAKYPQETVYALVEKMARLHPGKEAVRFGNKTFSYHELDTISGKIASLLVHEGIQAGDRIGLLIDRSEMLPVWLLAILKSGAAYIPLDPDYPANRITYMLENARAALLITQKKYSGVFSKTVREVCVEEVYDMISQLNEDPLAGHGSAHDLAYILYTSGSTGQPKGVMVEHRSVVNLLWHLHITGIFSAEDSLLAITTISFDIAVLEMFLPLITGGRLVVTDNKISRDGNALLQLLQKEQISIMQATPVTWKIMLAAGWQEPIPLTILCCGEPLPMDLARKLLLRCTRLYNYYGPTETTIYSTGTRITAQDTVITIGRPVANTHVYILDEHMQETTAEEEGELYIGGDGVARGYMNRADLTAERFIESVHGKLFRTGDLGKWTKDGSIYLFGRADHQIKIRGFRIEPGEIEACLLEQIGIRDAVVIAREDIPGNKILVAYIIPVHNGEEQVAGWRRTLQQSLPDYMVPHEYVLLDHFPLTPNGKTDRTALPRPLKKPAAGDGHVYTDTEKMIAGIWKETLETDTIGIDDDFFDAGGHSLIAVEIMCRLEEATGKRLPIAALFEAPTIRLLSRFIESEDAHAAWQSLVPVKTSGNNPPLYIVHGDGLNVMVFNSMARNLDPLQPVFGLQPKGMSGLDEPDESIEEMAAYYISLITANHPHGPYLLAGYSFGGIVAFEMARQLRQSGHTVSMLAMFDTNVGNINYTDSRRGRLWQKIQLQVPKMLFITRSFTKYPKDVLRYQCHVIKRKWRSVLAGIGLAELPEKKQLSEHEKRVFEKHQQAYHKYEMKCFEICVDLFRVTQRLYFLDDPRYLGWKRLAGKGVAVHEVPGDHRTFLLPPNDAVFADRLQAVINKRLQENVQNNLEPAGNI
jgi:amino acid adenylation domain-containing protein